jgi:hypothetical protein
MSNDHDLSDGDQNNPYEVGRGCPPKGTQFKKGQSGNPNGRPKRDAKFNALLEEILSEESKVKLRGAEAILTHREILARKAIELALKGKIELFIYLGSGKCRY